MSTRRPVVHGYCRVSHQSQVDRDSSLPTQEEMILRRYERDYKDTHKWGGFYTDAAISAYKIPFHLRPAARRLVTAAQEGDVVLVQRLDRLWRSIRDAVLLRDRFGSRGVKIYAVSDDGLGINDLCGDSPIACLTLNILVAIAEYESRLKGRRVKDACAYQRSIGNFINGIPIGMKAQVTHGKRRMVWCDKTRAVMGVIVDLRDKCKLSFNEIRLILPEIIDEKYGKGWYKGRLDLRKCSKAWIHKAYNRELVYRSVPPDTPPSMIDISQ